MDPQSNQDRDLSLPQPQSGMSATMPLPTYIGGSVQSQHSAAAASGAQSTATTLNQGDIADSTLATTNSLTNATAFNNAQDPALSANPMHASASPVVPAQAPPLTVQSLRPASPTIQSPVLRPTVPIQPVNDASLRSSNQASGFQTVTANADQLPPEAADSDVIEKEWVDKAKQIIAGTISDPYRQAWEINKLKADYMKKRYNKDIKLPEA